MQAVEQRHLIVSEVGMPEVHYEHYSRPGTFIPDLVREAVIENQTAAFLPCPRDPANTQPTILWHVDAEVTSQPHVGRPSVRGDVCIGIELREVGGAI
jgi:hypothetical protein